jgi:predicted amidohydrolase YtcJ
MAEKRLGEERCKTTYPFRDFLDAGAVLAFGSDGGMDPIRGIYYAVTRNTLDNKYPGGWQPQQKITVEEALKAYTWGTAYASFFEDRAGSLEVGKLADMVVLDKDILSIPPDEIKDVKVVMTIMDGRVVFMVDQFQ